MKQMLTCNCFFRNKGKVSKIEVVSRLLPYNFWLTLLFFTFCLSATAQVCTSSLGNPFFIENFGQGANTESVGPALPTGTTSMQYVGATSRCPSPGQYVIQSYSSGCHNWLPLSYDHTGNGNGFFMLIDAATTLDTFYVHTISGLCPGTTYEFSAWIANMNPNNSYVNPNITFTIEKPDHTILGTYSTGPITSTNPITWQKKGFFFTTPSGVNTVVLRMRNNELGINGNDLALDDIMLRPVGPNIAITAPGSVNNTDTICANVPVTLTAAVDNCYPSTAYQWQTSANGGVNWNNIVGANATTYTRPGSVAGTSLYRLVVAQAGSMGVSACQVYSSAFRITVNPTLSTSVSIIASSASICTGTQVIFTATPVNGGASPVYQWKLNGVNIGTSSPFYTNSSLVNGDVVTCTLTSNALCTSNIIATSNNIVMTVTAVAAVPAVTITTLNNVICQGGTAIFIATPSYGGSYPSYQWQINGNNIGLAGSSYYYTISGGFANGDVVTCLMTSISSCANGQNAISNGITMVVHLNIIPSISILPDVNDVCEGTPITFTTTFANAGTAPSFQWRINFVDVAGANGASFTSSNLANGDIVTCVLISSAPCSAPYTSSNNITVLAHSLATPTVTIAASTSNNICPGDSIAFIATPSNGVIAPTYQWKVNGINAGTNAPRFVSNALVNGDIVTCFMTGSTVCTSMATVAANSITISTANIIIPAITIAGTDAICEGKAAAFTATATNAGPAPVYHWKVNGINAGTNSNLFTSNTLTDGDIISCQVTSNFTCAPTATSNDIPIVIYALPNISMGLDKIINKGTSILLTPTITGIIRSYAWSPAASLSSDIIASPVASPAITTVYTLTVISSDDCQASATTTVRVQMPVFIPNTFSPNGDGVNDVWNITGLADYVNATVNIFNRYGQVVYQTYGYNKPWDGTSNGKPLPIGTYYYIIDLLQGGKKPLNGSITILR